MSEILTGPHHDPGRYEIRLRGHLDSRWAAWFDGLSLTNESDGTTIIRGPAIATLPVAAWEFSLGVWLVVKGFNPSPITAGMEAASSPPAYREVTV